jgi:NADH-quinone oxidoreductase subunit J
VTVEAWFFYPLAVLTAGSALGVVLTRNPLHGALWLVVSFFFLSAIYVLLGAHFVGILQIIVYAGAIMVLFLFVIMLLALSDADLGKGRMTATKVVGGVFSVGIIALALKALGMHLEPGGRLVVDLGRGFGQMPAAFGTVAQVAQKLFTDLPLQFEAVSLLLLVAIAGAVVVAKGRI